MKKSISLLCLILVGAGAVAGGGCSQKHGDSLSDPSVQQQIRASHGQPSPDAMAKAAAYMKAHGGGGEPASAAAMK